ncbi:hypothetical protein ZIOFF_046176 [Zingiber officinale]|uniref:ABC transporter B family member 25 n=1 Tax=Zingiber officinale TaxID=94328 RepID=A0A8J5KVY1_ZINOF|nr:hypothetical protein ZIOFF_046176 [Zingiber officinale]
MLYYADICGVVVLHQTRLRSLRAPPDETLMVCTRFYSIKDSSSRALSDLEHGDAIQPANVTFCRILKLAKPDAGKLVLATLALLIASTTSILIPKFGGKIIDIVSREVQEPGQKSEALDAVKNTVVDIMLIVIIGSICAALRAWLFYSASERVVARLRKDLFAHLVNQEIAFYDVTRTGELLSRLSEDTQIIKNAATTNLSEALRNITTTLVGLGFMFSTSWKLTCEELVLINIFIFVLPSIHHCSSNVNFWNLLGTVLALVVVPAIYIAVRKFGRYLRELSHQTQAAAAVAASIAEKVVGLFSGGLNAASTLSVVVVVIYGANLTINGSMTTGDLTSFILYSLTVGSSVSALSGLYTTAMKATGASKRVFQLLDRVSSMPKSGDVCPVSEQDGDVEIDDVWFAYPSRPTHMVLKVSIVSQEPVLFNCSIEENIAYGFDGKATVSEIENAAKMANAHEFISNFPDKYKTLVGERGIRLSGGQKQRVAIARALLMNPRVLLLDEATSALDAESEYLVQDAMDSLMKGRTVLVIAHRLSTVKSADTVAVISDGQIAERGTHDDLLSKDGIYTALVKRQLQGSKSDTAEETGAKLNGVEV